MLILLILLILLIVCRVTYDQADEPLIAFDFKQAATDQSTNTTALRKPEQKSVWKHADE